MLPHPPLPLETPFPVTMPAQFTDQQGGENRTSHKEPIMTRSIAAARRFRLRSRHRRLLGIQLFLGFVLDHHPFEKLPVSLREKGKRLAIVGIVLERLLHKLKARNVLVENFSPGLHTDSHGASINEATFGVWSGSNFGLNKLIVFV